MKRIILLVIATLSVLVTDAQCLKIEYAGDVLSEKEQQLVERMMVYQIRFYRLFGLRDSLKVKLTVFNERSVAEFYLDTIGVSKNNSIKNINGLYSSKRKEAIIMEMDKNRKKGLSVIYHELSHYLTREITGTNPPMWLSEGLSEYFENCEVGKKSIRHSMTPYEKGRIRSMYMLGEVNLRNFVNSDRSMFMKKQRTDEQYAYILAHALTTFMLENVSRQFFSDFITLLQDKTDRAKVSDKIARVYPGGFEAFETDFEKFCE